MSETAAHLGDSVLPVKPIRQWVLSFPVQIRLCLAVKPKIMARALDIANSTISAYYRKKLGLPKHKTQTGAVTFIQRFGGSLNVNVHFHHLFVDGLYDVDEQGAPTVFRATEPPAMAELEQVLTKIIKRLVRYLEKINVIAKDEEDGLQLEIPDEDVLSRLQATSVTYRFATGPSKGKKAIVIKTLPDEDHNAKGGLVSKQSGFSLHAGVATKAHERARLERICRYTARPAVSEERLSLNSQGDVVYKLKRPWDDGTTAVKMTQMELMERLAALVPRPRVHLTRFHGCLAPHYKYRSQIVPQPKKIPTLTVIAGQKIEGNHTACANQQQRISWARLLKRVFNIDVEYCPHCGQRMKIIAAIEEPKVIAKILEHLRLPTSAPRLAPARAPPPDLTELYVPPENFW